jgi:ribosomal protein L7Ae-like RNA K-turn-binding protein
MKSGNLIFGYNNCIVEIKKDKCRMVIVAGDASDNTREKFLQICISKKLPCFVFGTKEELGFSIGKFPTSVIAIKDEGMSKVVRSMLE